MPPVQAPPHIASYYSHIRSAHMSRLTSSGDGRHLREFAIRTRLKGAPCATGLRPCLARLWKYYSECTLTVID